MIDQISIPVGSKSLDIQIGKLAKQADGAAVVRFGDTVVLATAVFSKEPKENADFFPLTVDYREPTYAAGRIPGGWFKREGRPTEKEILTSRLIDRPRAPALPEGLQPRDPDRRLRPLGRRPERSRHPRHQRRLRRADLLGRAVLLARSAPCASAASTGAFVLNPTNAERDKSDMDLIVCGTQRRGRAWSRAGAKEVSERDMIDAILFGHEAVRQIVGAQLELQRRGGFQKPHWQAPEAYPPALFAEVRQAWEEPMMAAMTLPNKIASYAEIKAVKKAAVSLVPEAEAETRASRSPRPPTTSSRS